MLITLRHARRTSCLLSLPVSPSSPSAAGLLSTVDGTSKSIHTTFNPTPDESQTPARINSGMVSYFREWFIGGKKPFVFQIYEILSTKDASAIDRSLSELNLRLTERLVLDVLHYNRQSVFACVKFFDWAARQSGFHHTRATFTAIFRILCNAQMTELMQESLKRYRSRMTHYDIKGVNRLLVIGYCVSGKCESALGVFSRMRFAGHANDMYLYQLLLNTLIEHGHYEIVGAFVKDIRIRGYESRATHSLVVKSLSRQKQFDKAEEYVHSILSRDGAADNCGDAVVTLIGALCQDKQYKRAALLAEEIREMGVVSTQILYSAWIGELLNAGKVDGALKFFEDKKALEGYVPDVFRYNMLVHKLLRQNRFEVVIDLFMEMKDMGILPDESTWNAALCLFCKVGRMDLATELYHSTKEFGFSVHLMAYNYLTNTIIGDGSADELCALLTNSVQNGYFPGERHFLTIADALCREGKHDKMKELVLFVLERNIKHNVTYDKLILILCKSSKLDDAYWVYSQLRRVNKPVKALTYHNLILEFTRSRRVEIACRLVVDMQVKGFIPRLKLVRKVIGCICKIDNPDNMIFRFLEIQLAIPGVPTSRSYLSFIDGAAYAIKPELAQKLYNQMETSGVEPEWDHGRVLLLSALKGSDVTKALHLFYDLLERFSCRKKKKKKMQLWQLMISGLCRAKKPVLADFLMRKMKSQSLTPSTYCYEELVKLYFRLGEFQKAVGAINDMTQIPRPVSTFIGNAFLMQSFKSSKLYESWAEYAGNKSGNLTDACWSLGHLSGVFSNFLEGTYDIEDIENMIRQCFPMDRFTINLLLRRATLRSVDYACEYFHRLCEKGFEPDSWSYYYIVSGLKSNGRMAEAEKWTKEMEAVKPTRGYRGIISFDDFAEKLLCDDNQAP